jgi:geranylgeranyl diphosphate synthase type II
MHSATAHAAVEGVAAAGVPNDLTLLVNDYLAQLRFAREPGVSGLQEAMQHSLLAPGKRVRPVLALATARAIGHDPREVLPLAAALELIHTFTLVHDDLPALDEHDVRRGRPAAHVRFGEDVAILAGDALFAEAFRLVLSEQPGEPANVLAALSALTDASGVNGLAGGQYLDVRGLGGARSVGLRCLHRLKTGALMRASVESVLLLHGVTGVTLDEFRKFADELGLLFQIVDDILDGAADARHGRVTYVSRFGQPWARSLAEQTHVAALAALARAVPEGADELVAIADFFLDRTS